MKKILRTSEEYRNQKEKELKDARCPECDKEGAKISYNLFETVYSCECGCEWCVVDEELFEMVELGRVKLERLESSLKSGTIKKGETIFEKIRKKFRIIRLP